MNKLASLAEFTVIPFDTDVAKDKIFVWKKGENRKKERVLIASMVRALVGSDASFSQRATKLAKV